MQLQTFARYPHAPTIVSRSTDPELKEKGFLVAEHPTRKLAVILHADVVGSTTLVQKNESLAHARIQDAFRRFSSTIEAYNGVTHELRGDALVAEFARASEAVSAGLAFQIENTESNARLEDDLQPQLRIGISLGEVVIADNTITGAGVVLAQRVEQLAEPGGVCITGAIHEAVPQYLPLDYSDLGKREVKGFEEPVQVYSASVEAGKQVSPPEPAVSMEAQSRKPKRLWTAGAIVLLVLVVGGLAWWQPWKPEFEPASMERMAFTLPDKPSIAVLPFTNMSGDAEQEYFVDGMTEDLITDISKLTGLFVIARNSTFTYKGKSVKVGQVAEELGVRYVLEGSVRRAGNRVRINAQLIDATSGGHLWAERYDRDFRDIFALQDEVVGKIVSALAVKLTLSEQAQLRRKPTDVLEAYDYYLRAKQGAYNYDGEGLAGALSLYEKAMALDPKFAGAYAGYARAAVDVWRYDVDWVLPGPVARKRAYEAASHALSLDSDIPEAFSVLGVLQMVDSRYDEAIASARKAVSLDPNNAEAYLNLALVLTHAGRSTEAVEAMETAFRLNPRPSPGTYLLSGLVLFMDHQYERATEVLEKSREAMPANEAVHEQLAMAYAQLGRLDEARTELNDMLKKRPWVNLAYMRFFYAYHKRKEDLDHRLEALRKAGMPEWPFGYEGRTEDRLDPDAIKTVTFARTWVGHGTDGAPFMKQISEDGTIAYRDPSHSLTGVASVEGGMYCQQFPAILTGRKYCSHLYRNPEGTPEEKNEYVNVSIFRIVHFSLAE